MVVLRLIGDEWSWSDRIALSTPPQRPFSMSTTHLVRKLGAEQWAGLVLYRTEGRPPKFCRPTTPLPLTSCAQREGLRDGAVLWVRVGPSLAQQQRDRDFQRALDEWRGGRAVEEDGGDVKRFIAEMETQLSAPNARALAADEEEARAEVSGEEHRNFAHMTAAHRERVQLRNEEESARKAISTAEAVAAGNIAAEIEANVKRAAEVESKRIAEAAEEAKRVREAETEAKRAAEAETEAKRLAEDAAEAKRVAEAAAEAKRLAEAAEETKRIEEAAAEAKHLAEAAAEAKRVAEAAAEAQRVAEAAAEAKRIAEAAAEAKRIAERTAHASALSRSPPDSAKGTLEELTRDSTAGSSKDILQKPPASAERGALQWFGTDARAVLVAFARRHAIPPDALSASAAAALVDDLLLRCRSTQAAADAFCFAYHIAAHPLRRRFLLAAERHAPQLCAVVDVMLELCAGREAELMLWVRPELAAAGRFEACGGYYYHTAAGISQWESPAAR